MNVLPGPMMVLDVFETEITHTRVKINDIPKSIFVSTMGKEYQLMGVVAYEFAGTRTKQIDELAGTVQQFIAFLLTDTFWTLIDDMKTKTPNVTKQTTAIPAILIYGQI